MDSKNGDDSSIGEITVRLKTLEEEVAMIRTRTPQPQANEITDRNACDEENIERKSICLKGQATRIEEKRLVIMDRRLDTTINTISDVKSLVTQLRRPSMSEIRESLSVAKADGTLKRWLLKISEMKFVDAMEPFEDEDIYTYGIAAELMHKRMTRTRTNTELLHTSHLKAAKAIEKMMLPTPHLFREMALKYGTLRPEGMLLYGPPGCGKTYLVESLAEKASRFLVSVPVSELYEHFTYSYITEFFSVLKKLGNAALFIDEIELFCIQRDNYGGFQRLTTSAFLKELDGLKTQGNLAVVGATNTPWLVEPAVLRSGRIGNLIYVGPPDFDARIGLFGHYSKNLPIKDVDFEKLAEKTDFYSCSDIEKVCCKAGEGAYSQFIQSSEEGTVTHDDFELAISRVAPTTIPWFEQASQFIFSKNADSSFAEMADDICRYRSKFMR